MRLPAWKLVLIASLLLVGAASARAAAAPELLSGVPADTPEGLAAKAFPARIHVRARIAADGLVDSASASGGDPALCRAAAAAVRWYVYRPQPGAAPRWADTTLVFATPDDDDALVPDFPREAQAAERAGDLPTAVAWWSGALHHLGSHPAIRNGYAIREHVIALERSLKTPLPIPSGAAHAIEGQSALLERVVARGQHADVVAALDQVLLEVPWACEAYRCRTAALAGCGRQAEALRSARLYQLAAVDSTDRALSAFALHELAAGDTIGVSEKLKLRPLRPETEPGE